MLKIALIGSTSFRQDMQKEKEQVERLYGKRCVKIRLPEFDNYEGSTYEMCKKNRKLIKWSDSVHLYWDGRSTGTIFDLGMCFALEKPLVVKFLEKKSFKDFVETYEQISKHLG